jgi:hypothetical protein
VLSQGDAILRADLARATFGVTGAGIRVGVISDGILGLDEAKASGDLPPGTCGPQSGGVTTIDPSRCRESVTAGREGTAMMEIVHDLAPGAELSFCGASTSLEMVACIEFLAARADVIVDDRFFSGEPYFEDGMVARAAARAVANGVVYVAAAGNDAENHYQGLYVDSGNGLGSHQISPGNTSFNIVGVNVSVVLQWSNPFGSSADNYDLCREDDTPTQCARRNTAQNGNDDPIESAFCPTGCALQVRLVSGSPQILELFVFGGTLVEPDRVAADSVFGLRALREVLTVGTIRADDPGNDRVASYSSRGPATILFPAPDIRLKPDVVAIDGVSVSGAGGFSKTFVGTSAAAPHAAAVAALVLEANPSLAPAQVRDVLQRTAVPPESPVPNSDSGFGRIDALAAVQSAKLQPDLAINLNQTTFRPGEGLTVGLAARTGGPGFSADLYFGVILPDRKTLVLLTSVTPLAGMLIDAGADPRTLRPLLANTPVPVTLDNLLPYTFSGGEAPGEYTFVAALLKPGALSDGIVDAAEIFAVVSRSFAFSP